MFCLALRNPESCLLLRQPLTVQHVEINVYRKVCNSYGKLKVEIKLTSMVASSADAFLFGALWRNHVLVSYQIPPRTHCVNRQRLVWILCLETLIWYLLSLPVNEQNSSLEIHIPCLQSILFSNRRILIYYVCLLNHYLSTSLHCMSPLRKSLASAGFLALGGSSQLFNCYIFQHKLQQSLTVVTQWIRLLNNCFAFFQKCSCDK